MEEKEVVKEKVEELAEDLADDVTGGDADQANCGELILRDCQGFKQVLRDCQGSSLILRKCQGFEKILRDGENECTFRTRFIRSELAEDLADDVTGGDADQANCGELILRDCQGSQQILRKCHGFEKILRDGENECPFRTRFIRSDAGKE